MATQRQIEMSLDSAHKKLDAIIEHLGIKVGDRRTQRIEADAEAKDAWKPGVGRLWLDAYGDPNASTEEGRDIPGEEVAFDGDGPGEGEVVGGFVSEGGDVLDESSGEEVEDEAPSEDETKDEEVDGDEDASDEEEDEEPETAIVQPKATAASRRSTRNS